MKPLNAKERKKAFWTYLGFFVLALIPICAAIYLHGRVSRVENEFLRTNYTENTQRQSLDESERAVFRAITWNSESLKEYLNKEKATSISKDKSGEIDNLIADINTSLSPLGTKLGLNPGLQPDSSYRATTLYLTESLKLLNNEYYRKAWNEINALEKEIEEKDDEIKALYKRIQYGIITD